MVGVAAGQAHAGLELHVTREMRAVVVQLASCGVTRGMLDRRNPAAQEIGADTHDHFGFVEPVAGHAAGAVSLLVSRGGSEKAEARLRAMLDSTDGFVIAEADLEIRGPGDFLGTRQSGHLPELRVAELLRDVRLVAVARQAALETVRADPGLARAPTLRRAVDSHWGDRLALVDVG